MKLALVVLAVIACASAFPDVERAFNDLFDEIPPQPADLVDDDDRIIGGSSVSIEQFPWQLSVRFRGLHRCGGTVLSARQALTAAHCVPYPAVAYTVLAGTNNHTDTRTGVIRQVARYIRHPQYNSRTTQNDIAILVFVTDLPLSLRIRPITLPAPNANVPVGAWGTISGWGLTRQTPGLPAILQATAVPIITNERCAQAYGARITNEMFCAGQQQGGRGPCIGDNGGALIVQGVQFGIISWSRGCAEPNLPAVYTRVPLYTEWIRSQAA